MTKTVTFDNVVSLIRERGSAGRSMTAIVGPPGTGKSTTSIAIAAALNRDEPGSAVVMQMDGYHYDDGVLRSRSLLSRKGAPETFDLGGLDAMLARLKANKEREIAVPVFDRTLEISRGSAAIIHREARHLIIEGNYLLYQVGDWQNLHAYFDTTIWIHTATDDLRERLINRWKGLGLTAEEIADKVDGNDLPNAELARRCSAEPEFSLPSQSGVADAPATSPASRLSGVSTTN
ncbi:hypothetical protein [Devosia sp.]|uniref:hypothetical protein n=1 Tax=Devosia sp. TaxID=1871048 RepID=UPI001ACC9B38|nr:hypothetical protein [Devosia sp.]MBN9334726.1 hypothetical protein [Devosia sp.]